MRRKQHHPMASLKEKKRGRWVWVPNGYRVCVRPWKDAAMDEELKLDEMAAKPQGASVADKLAEDEKLELEEMVAKDELTKCIKEAQERQMSAQKGKGKATGKGNQGREGEPQAKKPKLVLPPPKKPKLSTSSGEFEEVLVEEESAIETYVMSAAKSKSKPCKPKPSCKQFSLT